MNCAFVEALAKTLLKLDDRPGQGHHGPHRIPAQPRVARSLVVRFAKWQKHSRLDADITQLRFVGPDVALVHARGAVVKGTHRRTRRNTKVQTYVAVRQDGSWLFAAFQNTRYHPFMAAMATRMDSRMAPTLPA